MNTNKIVDSFNALARCKPEKLPERLHHQIVGDFAERAEWYRITEDEWRTLQPFMDADCTFQVKINEEEELQYNRKVASAQVVSDGSGWVWVRVDDEDADQWGMLLRVLIVMVDRFSSVLDG